MTRPRGLTLIELLLAAGVGVLVIGGVFTALVVGMTAWRRLQAASTAHVAVALESFADRFTNAPLFEAMPCDGAATRVAFAALVNTALPGAPPAWTLGRVEYAYDADRQTWGVKEFTYGGFLNDAGPVAERTVLTGVSAVTLEYLTRDRERRTADWAPSWSPPEEEDEEDEEPGRPPPDRYPWAVRATIVIRDAQGRPTTWIKSAAHPVQ